MHAALLIWDSPIVARLKKQSVSCVLCCVVLLRGDSFQARSLLGLLMLMGVIVGFSVGCMAISVPWFFPYIFTKDPAIIAKVESLPKGINFSLLEGSLHLEVLVCTILLRAELGDFRLI